MVIRENDYHLPSHLKYHRSHVLVNKTITSTIQKPYAVTVRLWLGLCILSISIPLYREEDTIQKLNRTFEIILFVTTSFKSMRLTLH